MSRRSLLTVLVLALTACSTAPASTPAITSVPISIPIESTPPVTPNALLLAIPTSEAKVTAEPTAVSTTLENLTAEALNKIDLIQGVSPYANAMGLTIPQV
jgi:hypothetical protein